MKKSQLKKLIEEVLDEMTTSGAAGPYATPNWARGHHSKDAVAKRSIPGGKIVEPEEKETDDTTIGESAPIVRRELEEGRSRYRNFKESDLMRNHSKVSYGINQAKKTLKEVAYLVSLCERLKTECDITTDNLWKRTKPDMMEIHRSMKEIANRLHRLGKR
jgi:hypothetical protein